MSHYEKFTYILSLKYYLGLTYNYCYLLFQGTTTMIELTGINLGERKKELNVKINDAINKKVNFEEINSQTEISDSDKLYKIGVASKYKDVEYIISILKSGDSLYISRVLKCFWLYDNEYSYIINPKYLHENIFPLVPLKLTRKILTAISLNLGDQRRGLEFYSYCDKMQHMNIANKFILFIPEEFKLESLKNKNVLNKLNVSDEFLRLFVGNSFVLAEAYYNTTADVIQINTLYRLRHLYFVSNIKYLEMLKKKMTNHCVSSKQIGLRISKDIMKKYKEIVCKNPMICLHLLNRSILIRYSTVDDVQLFAKTLISYENPTPTEFWDYNMFYDRYDCFLNRIPFDQRLQFIKNTFTHLYPNKEFENSIEFYKSKLYKLMTPDEREKWALRQIESGLELLGNDKDYKWYRFVSFEKSFDAIKKRVMITENKHIRYSMITVLVESAKTENELEILFDYYYKRHINEKLSNKELFVEKVLSEHNVYNFSTNCWDAFNKILFSLEIYNSTSSYFNGEYRMVALIYHVIHGKKVPEAVNTVLDSSIYVLRAQTCKLSGEKQSIIYKYILNFYIDKIKAFNDKAYNDNVKDEVKIYINFILDLLDMYHKSKEDIPDIVNKYINLDFESYSEYNLIKEKVKKTKLNIQQQLMVYLKTDKELVISYLPSIKEQIVKTESYYKVNTFLKTLRTYFSNDLAKEFLELFKDLLTEPNVHVSAIKTAVYGIFELADSNFIKDFTDNYVPIESKINRHKIDPNTLYIQKSICAIACNSRPPLPLSEILKFIKGDYIYSCLPVFDSYMAKMVTPLTIEIVRTILNTPVSAKKGIRLAFKCFSVEDLRKLILDVWMHSKSISMRSLMYTALFNKIASLEKYAQAELFEDLKLFTGSLHENDNEKIFKLFTSDSLPQRFIGEYLEVVWNLVDKLPENAKFTELKENIINCIGRNYCFINGKVIEPIISDHINILLKVQKTNFKNNYNNPWKKGSIMESKCALFYNYTLFFTDDKDFRKKSDLIMAEIKECLRIWNKVENNEYIIKKTFNLFINALNEKSYKHDVKNYARTNLIFEQILKELEDTLQKEEVYEIIWKIRICIITRNTMIDAKEKPEYIINQDMINNDLFRIYGKKFTNLLVESIESRKCYVSYFKDIIEDALTLNLRLILMNMYNKNDVTIEIVNMRIIICLELLEYDSFETYMFALKLLPQDFNQNNQYVNIINKFKSCEYDEVKCNMYNRFETA